MGTWLNAAVSLFAFLVVSAISFLGVDFIAYILAKTISN